MFLLKFFRYWEVELGFVVEVFVALFSDFVALLALVVLGRARGLACHRGVPLLRRVVWAQRFGW